MIIAVSDTHIGFEEFNKEEFMQFLDFVLTEQPDQFLLVGDIIEYWRNGIEPVMATHADIFSKINDIEQTNTDVIVIAGNHDWRLVTSEDRGISNISPPWNVKREYTFTSGDKEFIAKHGHQFDLANANPLTNRLLCLTDDDVGEFISSAYSRAVSVTPSVSTFARKPQLIARPSLGTIANLNNPNILATQPERERADRIRNRIQSVYDEFVIFGHTHIPQIGDGYANCGSWTLDENTYIQIDEEQVDLRVFG